MRGDCDWLAFDLLSTNETLYTLSKVCKLDPLNSDLSWIFLAQNYFNSVFHAS